MKLWFKVSECFTKSAYVVAHVCLNHEKECFSSYSSCFFSVTSVLSWAFQLKLPDYFKLLSLYIDLTKAPQYVNCESTGFKGTFCHFQSFLGILLLFQIMSTLALLNKSFASIIKYSLNLLKNLEILLKTMKQTGSLLLQDKFREIFLKKLMKLSVLESSRCLHLLRNVFTGNFPVQHSYEK